MRCAFRFLLGAALIILVPLFILTRLLLDLCNQYNVSEYIRTFINHGVQGDPPPIPAKPGDKIIVMAKLEHENTEWVAGYLPEYALTPPKSSDQH